MVFSSTVFLFLFLPLIILLYYNPIIKSRRFRNIIIFSGSIVFYSWGEHKFVFVMLFSIFVNWILGIIIDGCESKLRKIWFIAALIFDIGILFVFKYAGFTVKNINYILDNKLPDVNIALPIGISFFTFQILSYIIDLYKKKVDVQRSFLNLGVYISMFPQLIAGPIVRYDTIAKEIDGRKENITDFTEGFCRFVYGLGKKVLIANYMAVVADNIFAFSGSIAFITAWIGIIAYTLQIYFDFSGYSDMAVGLGRIFGFHFNENFNYPYIAKSVTEFWRRWHISLSSWFRDYIYIPLGGNRCSRIKWVRNLFIVWLLTGIWHGANWTFIVWGLIYFVMLLFEKLTKFPGKLNVVSHIYTVLIVIIAWVFFRSPSLRDAIDYIGVMFGINSGGLTDRLGIDMLQSCRIILPIAIILTTPIYKKLLEFISRKSQFAKIVAENLALMFIFVLSVLACVKSSYNPFIYFNF